MISIDSPSLPVIKKTWRLEDENEDLISFDVGLMPLGDDLWSRGKCGLKIIQYLSVGVPAVCTPVGINRDIVKDGQNGFWATTPDDWINRLTQLIRGSGPAPEDGGFTGSILLRRSILWP